MSSRVMELIRSLEEKKQERDLREYQILQAAYAKKEAQSKDSVNRLTQLYHSTSSVSMKNHVRESLRNLYSSLDPYMKAAVDPYIKQSPIDSQEEKLRLFTKMNPAPPPPGTAQELNIEKKGNLTEITQPDVSSQTYAEQYFAFEDWKAKRDAVMLGVSTPPKNYLQLDGGAAFRDKDGSVSVLSDQDLALKEFAKDLNTTVAKLKLDGGYYYGERTLTQREGDNVVTYKVGQDIIKGAGRESFQLKEISRKPVDKQTPESYPSGLGKFMQEFVAENKENPLVSQVTKIIESEKYEDGVLNQLINETLRTSFPGYSFRLKKTKDKDKPYFEDTLGWWNYKNYSLIPIRGVAQPIGFQPGTTKPAIFWVDENQNVYDGANRRLGTLDQIKEKQGVN